MSARVQARYGVVTFHTDQGAWAEALKHGIAAEIHELGVHRSVQVDVTTDMADVSNCPAVGVYLASRSAATDGGLLNHLETALQNGMLVIPVVASLKVFARVVPSALAPLNGWEWAGADPARRLARRILEELGIEDRRRRVFISHKREDGLVAAEQLHDFLSHQGFEPFIDRFGIGLGEDVQNEIADALEDCAFLLLLETPLAHRSAWVFDEVEYAQSHQMGMHIVSWPGDVTELPGTNRLPRQALRQGDLRQVKGFDLLTDTALDDLLIEVEAAHANALVRRRRYLLRSVEEAARAAGRASTPLEQWRLLVTTDTDRSVVQVSPRLPAVEDLHSLDQARQRVDAGDPSGVLVHSARQLQPARRDMLSWAVGRRALTVIPENAIGRLWV